MRKKRSRTVVSKRTTPVDAEKVHQHSQSLVEDVREARDVEFATEKKTTERAKRRKLLQKRELRDAKEKGKTISDAKGNVGKTSSSRMDGLQVWKDAALRRKANDDSDDADPVALDSSMNDSKLRKSGVDGKTSSKIFQTAREQRAEIREEHMDAIAEDAARKNAEIDVDLDGVGERRSRIPSAQYGSDDDSEDDDEDNRTRGSHTLNNSAHDEEELEFLDAANITEEEELALSMFYPNGGQNTDNATSGQTHPSGDDGQPRILLADIILAKIKEKEEADAKAAADAADPERVNREKKIAEVYGLVGNILSRYRSGKIPKAFKIIPKQPNWEDLIYLTRPDEWTPAAVYLATRLLASNLPAKQVVKYYSDILLPRCLEDISDNKRLNYHLYRALSKAVYKPEAFSKGILFPVCEDPSCTLRQATIIGSVMSKVSIPMLHSAAALLYICELPYSPPNSIIITALIEKKYALPYRVLDGLVESFLRMQADPRPLPLMWHQSLLAFAQRYKMELTMEQKEKLKILMRVKMHHAITPEIRRELFSARNRGDLMEPDANTIARNIASAAMVM